MDAAVDARPSKRSTARLAATPYLSLLLVGAVGGLWAGYLWPSEPTFKGQALAVLVPAIFFIAAVGVWFMTSSRRAARTWSLAFLLAVFGAWITNMATAMTHADLFTHLVWFTPLIVLMIAIKPPTAHEGLESLIVLAWSIAIVLSVTLVLEIVGFVDQKFQPTALNEYNEARYFLPLNDILGIEGRWPGPFGHYNTTALFGALLIVLALMSWHKMNGVLILVGATVLLVTDSRTALGAAVVGVIVMAVLTTTGPVSRVSRPLRALGALVVVIGAGIYVLFRPTGLTGREAFWPAFLDLWQSAPWIGVGTSGIAVSGGITQEWGHAHNQYIDLLARYGVVSLGASLIVLAIALILAVRAGLRGVPGPLAVLVTYLVSGLGDTRNDWLHPGPLVLLIVILGMTSASVIREVQSTPDFPPPQLAEGAGSPR